MTLSLSMRSSLIVKSEIRNMSIECERASGLNLAQGICDLELSSVVADGAIQAIERGENHYSRHDGNIFLREAISEKLRIFNKIDTDPDRNIVVSAGATGAFYSACMALLDPGDEVIIFEPFYGYHVNTIRALNLAPKFVQLTPPGWVFDVNQLEDSISCKTKAVLINTPANPCGKVFTREEIGTIASICLKNSLFVLTDEIYEYFVYDENIHISPGSSSLISDQSITISGHSKTFSITGWRIGYAACHERWAQMIGFINDLVYVCAPSPLQYGVAHGINGLHQSFYSDLVVEYRNKRNQICSVLETIGITPYVPQGAYYVLANVDVLPGKNSKEKAMFILQKSGVACVPGSAFYHDEGGENLVRFCFAKKQEILDLACERLLQL